MSNGIRSLPRYQQGGPVSDRIRRLWEGIRGRADDPSLGYIGASMLPGVGEATDLVEIGAGLQDRNIGRIGLGLGALALPMVSASVLRKLMKGIRKLPAERMRLADLPQMVKLDRAKRMGYDLDVYHGTELPFYVPNKFKVGSGRFGPGVYTTTNPKDARNWIPSVMGRLQRASSELPMGQQAQFLSRSARSPRIYPLKVRSRNLIEYEGKEWSDLAEELGRGRHPSREKWHRNEEIAKLARERGWEGVFNPPASRRSYDLPDYRINYDTGLPYPKGERFIDYMDQLNTGTEIMIFDPKNIRSRWATFDPAKVESEDISAGIAGLLGVGAAEAARRNYVERNRP